MATVPRIGIITDIEDGLYKIKREYADSVSKAGGLPFLLSSSGDPLLYAREMEGILIPGGDDLDPSYYGGAEIPGLSRIVSAERSGFEIRLIHEIIGLKKPLLCICYGMQILNVAFGGSLYRDIKSELHGAIEHREGHDITIKEGGPLKAGEYRVNSTHHQAVKKIGKGLEIQAVSADGVVEAVYGKGFDGYVLGVQWHPERPTPDGPPGLFEDFIKECLRGK